MVLRSEWTIAVSITASSDLETQTDLEAERVLWLTASLIKIILPEACKNDACLDQKLSHRALVMRLTQCVDF